MTKFKKTAVFAALAVMLCLIFASCGDAQINRAEKAFKACMNAALKADLDEAKKYVAEGGADEDNNIISGIESMKSSFGNEVVDDRIVDEFFKVYLAEMKYKIKNSEKRGSNHVYITYELTAPDYDRVFEIISGRLKEKYMDMARKDVSEEDVMTDLTEQMKSAIKEAGSSATELRAVVEKDSRGEWKVDFSSSEDVNFKE